MSNSLINRRNFIGAGMAGAAFALSGGFLFVRRSQRRAATASEMLDDALPRLTTGALQQTNTLPIRAREEMRLFFHGKCLNVPSFVDHICSQAFIEQLGRCRTPDERESCFQLAFFSRIASDSEILGRVETVAAEIGSDIDTAWSSYCVELSGRWNTRIQGHGARLRLNERLCALIRSEISQAAREAVQHGIRPSIGQTIGNIGESAIRLFPVSTERIEAHSVVASIVSTPFAIPVFFLEAARHVWNYVWGQLHDRSGDYRAAISGRLALLGNRVGTEFEREVRHRLADLHTWQQRSIRETAGKLAEERIHLF